MSPSQARDPMPPDVPGTFQRIEEEGETRGDSVSAVLQMISLPHYKVRSLDHGFS